MYNAVARAFDQSSRKGPLHTRPESVSYQQYSPFFQCGNLQEGHLPVLLLIFTDVYAVPWWTADLTVCGFCASFSKEHPLNLASCIFELLVLLLASVDKCVRGRLLHLALTGNDVLRQLCRLYQELTHSA